MEAAHGWRADVSSLPGAGVRIRISEGDRPVVVQSVLDALQMEAGLGPWFGACLAALPWRAHAAGRTRVDVVPEVVFLNLQRDREDGATLRASGGSVLYGQLGVRASFGAFSVGAAVKRPLATRLNESAEQQGSEGLEVFRAALVIGYATRI